MTAALWPAMSAGRLAELGQRVVARAGAAIAGPGMPDAPLLLLAGLARIVVSAPDGRKAAVGYVRPGEFIGRLGGNEAVSSISAEAVGPCELLRVDRERLRAMAETDPAVAWQFVAALEHVLDESRLLGGSNALGNVEERVAVHLLHAATEHANGHRIVANLTQGELADAVGTAREVVARAIARLRTGGVIATRRGQIELLDPLAIGRLARAWLPAPPEAIRRGPMWPARPRSSERRADRRQQATAESRRVSVLLVDDDEDVAAVVRALLSDVMPDVRLAWAASAAAGLASIERGFWDVMIVDQALGDGTGVELLTAVSALEIEVPAIMLTGSPRRDTDLAAMAAGAVDFVPKADLDGERLERAIRYALSRSGALARARLDAEDARAEGRVDALTGLGNRRRFQEDMRRASGVSSVVVVIVDIDGLKRINDTHGHPAGDLALRAIGTALRRTLREADGLSRIGGDEFAAILAGADPVAVRSRLGHWIEARVDGLGRVSGTVGIAAGSGGDVQAVIEDADADLRSRRMADA